MKYLIIAGLWGAYCVLHSFLISTGFTNFLSRKLKKYIAFYRLFYVLISFLLLIPLINITDQIKDGFIITYSPPWSAIRYVFMYGSLLIFAWAFFFSYDPLSFFGIRQIQKFFRHGESNSDGKIKKGGLLGVTRHPMYLALIIYLWSVIFTAADLLVTIILTIYVIIGTRLEEKKLILEFGEAYKEYQHEVPMLIPLTKRKVNTAHRKANTT